jgi:hypothetical protein
MKTVFCTYGDQSFVKSRSRLAAEASGTDLFDKCIVFTEEVKNTPEFLNQMSRPSFAEVANSARGGGYWLWKPFIIRKTLASLNPGDIVVYSDAGSTIPHEAANPLRKIISRIADSEKGVLGCRNPFIEKDWTKGDVFSFFGIHNRPDITHSRQFSAGRVHVAKHCTHALSLYETWWDIARHRPDLFSDYPSQTANYPGFLENRHDASVWSLICKTRGVEEEWDWDALPILPTRIRQ